MAFGHTLQASDSRLPSIWECEGPQVAEKAALTLAELCAGNSWTAAATWWFYVRSVCSPSVLEKAWLTPSLSHVLYFLACLRPSGQNLQIPACSWSMMHLYDDTHLVLCQGGGGGLREGGVGRGGGASGPWRGQKSHQARWNWKLNWGGGGVPLGLSARKALDSRMGGQAGGRLYLGLPQGRRSLIT